MPQQDDASVTDAQALPVEPAAAAAPAAAKSAKSPLPPSVVEAAVPGSFCAQVWRSVDGIHRSVRCRAAAGAAAGPMRQPHLHPSTKTALSLQFPLQLPLIATPSQRHALLLTPR